MILATWSTTFFHLVRQSGITAETFEPENDDDRTVDLKVSANVSKLNFRVKKACDAKFEKRFDEGAYKFPNIRHYRYNIKVHRWLIRSVSFFVESVSFGASNNESNHCSISTEMCKAIYSLYILLFKYDSD